MKKNLHILTPIPLSDGEGGIPRRLLVLKFGRNDFTKGADTSSFPFDRKDGEAIIRDFLSRGKDLVVDYDHQTMVPGVRAPAAGWVSRLSLTEDGLEADVSWTDEASKALSSRQYRYHSPVLLFGRDGHPAKISSIALTNHPALHHYAPLVAHDTPQETNMDQTLKKLAGILGLELSFSDDMEENGEKTPMEGGNLAEAIKAIEAKIEELMRLKEKAEAIMKQNEVASLDDLAGKIAGMVPASEKAELQGRIDAILAEKAVEKAFADGKLIEAQRAWAMEYAAKEPKAFAAFVEKSPKVVPLSDTPCGGKKEQSKEKTMGFSEDDMEILRKFGVSPEDIDKKEKTNQEE
ncbi:MAG: phage protease [Candidatus Cryptobacteroides sp.]